MMLHRIPLALTAVVFAAAVSWLAPSVARAQPASATLAVAGPMSAAVGETVELVVTLTSPAGDPLARQQLLLVERVDFFDIRGRQITVASAATAENGVAVIRYPVRREGVRSLSVQFPGNDTLGGASAAVELTVAAGPATHTVERPAGIPGVNRFTLIVLLVAIWGTMLVIALHVAAIAREGSRADRSAKGAAR